MNFSELDKKSITNDEVHDLPVATFEGRIVLIHSDVQFESACKYLKSQPVLGFDTETKPSFRKGQINKVALLQLATREYAFLFRIHYLGFPDALIDILSDRKILKAGVAISNDLRALKKIKPFKPDGFFEIQQYVKNEGFDNLGLRKLAAMLLGVKISKRQQLSNWEADVLTEAQQKYAATDAWASFEIYLRLVEKYQSVPLL